MVIIIFCFFCDNHANIVNTCSFFQESPEDGGWHDLVAKGFIEYIDTEEEETTMISMTINVCILNIVLVSENHLYHI